METSEPQSALSTIETLRAEVSLLRENLQEQEAELAWLRNQANRSSTRQPRPINRDKAVEQLSQTTQFVIKTWSTMVWHGSSYANILPDVPTQRPELSERVREAIADRGEELGQWTSAHNEELFTFLDIDGDGKISAQDFSKAVMRPLVLEQMRSLVTGLNLDDVIARMLLQHKPDKHEHHTLLESIETLAHSSEEQVKASLSGLEQKVASAVRDAAKVFEDSSNIQRAKSGNAKFSSRLHYRFGSLEDFKEGLAAYLGLPDADIGEAMAYEHTSDKRGAFAADNYGTVTDPATEFRFAADPGSQSALFPGEEEAGQDPGEGRRRRSMEELMREEVVQTAGLSREEVLAVRLFTGPMFQIYNDVLRKRPAGRPYRNTLLMLISATMKLAWTLTLPVSRKVYRGLKGGELPPGFLLNDKHGCRGGVEFGFMSTSLDKEMSASYAGRGSLPIILEMDVGMIDRGAPISSLSQYPREQEVLFPPMSNLEIFGEPRVDMTGGQPMMVLQVRASMNLRHRTREELACDRKLIFIATLRNTVQAVAAALDTITREERPANPFLQKYEEFAQGAKQQVLRECLEVMASFEALQPVWFHDDHRYKNAVMQATQLRILALAKFRLVWDTAAYTNPQLSWQAKPMSEVHLERACQLRAQYRAASQREPPDMAMRQEAALQLSVLEGLVAAGDLEMPFDLDLNTALMLAAKDKSSSRARQLIHARCSLESTNRAGRTALLVAAQSGATNTVRELLLAKADVRQRDRSGLGCVMLASSNLHVDTVRVLLDASADPDAADARNNTPLILAAAAQHIEVMQELIAAGAALDAANLDGGVGGTALLIAAQKGNQAAVRLLIDSNASLDIQNDAGGTALMWAALTGQPAIVEMLLLARADPELVDCNGQNALRIAVELCQRNTARDEVIRLLRDAVAVAPDEHPDPDSLREVRDRSTERAPAPASASNWRGPREGSAAGRKLSYPWISEDLALRLAAEAVASPGPSVLRRPGSR